MKSYLKRIDTTTQGRYDVTPLFTDADAFRELVEEITDFFSGDPVDLVAGIDALGFILGTAVAVKTGRGFLPIRKHGKLPGSIRGTFFTDYSGKEKGLEVRPDAFPRGTRILLVDEWIETGAQMDAAARLIEALGGRIIGIATIGFDRNPATADLESRYKLFAAARDM